MLTLIQNGQVYIEGQIQPADLLIAEGRILAIGQDLASHMSADQVLDVKGMLVAPGLVDMHVHFRDPGYTEKEDVLTGSRAALHGGVTTVGALANVDPVPNTVEDLKKMEARNQSAGLVHIHQFAPITRDLTSNDLVDFEAMAEAGAVGFSNDGQGVQESGTMYEAMLQAKRVNRPIAAHVEDASLRYGGAMNAGSQADKLGIPGILDVSETAQLARDLVLAKATGAHYHVCHLTTAESVHLVRMAKADGVPVTAEVTPQHLVLSDKVITVDSGRYKVNPPLGSEEDRAALLEGVKDGTIDIVATDHAPHTQAEKTGPMVESAFGLTGLETSFSVLYTKLVRTGKLKLEELLDLMTIKPAQVYNLPDVGRIAVGQPADLAIFDLDQSFEVTEDSFYSKGKNSPFVGWTLYGKTAYTLVDGKVAYPF